MERQRTVSIVALVVVLIVSMLGWAGNAAAAPPVGEKGGKTYVIDMTGAAERPGPGHPDATGTAIITLNPGLGQVCYELTVEGLDDLTVNLAHIHRGAVDVSGPPVVDLIPPADGSSSDCIEGVDRGLIVEMISHPERFYVNVHAIPGFGPGAVRGQLG